MLSPTDDSASVLAAAPLFLPIGITGSTLARELEAAGGLPRPVVGLGSSRWRVVLGSSRGTARRAGVRRAGVLGSGGATSPREEHMYGHGCVARRNACAAVM